MNFIVELLRFGFLGIAVLPLVAFGLAGNVICSVLVPILGKREPKLKTTVIGGLLAAGAAAALMVVVGFLGTAHLGERIRFTEFITGVITVYFWNCYFVLIPQLLFLLLAKRIRFTPKIVIAGRLVITLLFVLALGFAHYFVGRSILGLPSD